MKKILLLFASTLLLFPFQAFTWTNTGHMLVVKIAESQIKPEAREKIDNLLEEVGCYSSRRTAIFEAACWEQGYTYLCCSSDPLVNTFRQYEIPYDPFNLLSEKEKEKIASKNESGSVCFALRSAMWTLRYSNCGSVKKNFMLQVLLRATGDIHQPLNCICRYTPEIPDGDYFGRRFSIKNFGTNLGAFWCTGLGLFSHPEWDHRQHDCNSFENLEGEIIAFANQIMEEYPPEMFRYKISGSFEDWAMESHQVAIEHAYRGIDYRCDPTNYYISRCQPVALRQIALAGYRLAALLNLAFSKDFPEWYGYYD